MLAVKIIDKIGIQQRNFTEVKLAFEQPLSAQPLKEHPQGTRPAGTVLGSSSNRKLKQAKSRPCPANFPPRKYSSLSSILQCREHSAALSSVFLAIAVSQKA